ncbi:M20 family metallopeptidase [Priestia koreensis]|uniref:Peptidase M20 n=1 Tax=Priestia koreensis TaxID=284581 RepID=A0A0M0LH28_9BACI|nr:M20 family metallopeptidase [Priestia koreensis]KOO50222.1 peptidase M20 [Priestia koreensis]
MIEQLFAKLESAYPEMVDIRRYLHQHPELSFHEHKTTAYIAAFYEELGVDIRTNVGGNGIVATIKGAHPGETVALRADFDALQIHEDNDLPYKSTVPGVMHACGHDGHTATLLVLGKVLHEMRDSLHGNVVLIHQHAEELTPGGAKPMIEDGCLDGVDVIFGTHLWATAPTGTIQYRVGPFMAAADRFELTIKGAGGHGAQPHKCKDSILVASQLVTNLQQIVSRHVNPIDAAVLSIGSFVSDNAFNVIADQAALKGTVRTFKESVRQTIAEDIERIIKGVTLASDVDYDYTFHRGYPPVVNHEQEMQFVVDTAKSVAEVTTVEEIDPEMGAEDFAYYLENVKGAFFFTGAKAPETEYAYPHHHPKFDFDENAMLIAAKVLGKATCEYLKNEKTVSEKVTK